MSLDHGGHLTHGAKVNFSGKLFRAAQYGMRPDTGEIDYEQVQRLARRAPAEDDRRGLLGLFARHRLGAFRADRQERRRAACSWTWRTSRAWWPPGIYPNPLPHADVVTTTTHKTLRGPRGGLILARANDAITKKLNSHGVSRAPRAAR